MKLAIVDKPAVLKEQLTLTESGRETLSQLRQLRYQTILIDSTPDLSSGEISTERYKQLLITLPSVRAIYFCGDSEGRTCFCVYRPNKMVRHPEDIPSIHCIEASAQPLGAKYSGQFRGSGLLLMQPEIYPEASRILYLKCSELGGEIPASIQCISVTQFKRWAQNLNPSAAEN